MTKDEFESASLALSDTAWDAALLFELLDWAYNALARGNYEEWQPSTPKNQRAAPQ